MIDYTKDIAAYFGRVKDTLDRIDASGLSDVMNVLESARLDGRQVFVMGNGGSAATASHYVCDFNKGISESKDKKYKMLCLSDNVPMMMAYANDYDYSEVFVGPLKNYYNKGDVVIGISGSGNSGNVVKALEWARDNGAVTVGLTGYSGGKIKQIAAHNVHVPVDDMQIAEDLHMVLDHCMMKILCR